MYALFDCTGLLCNFRHAFRGIYVDDLWIVSSRDWTWGGVCVYNIYLEWVVSVHRRHDGEGIKPEIYGFQCFRGCQSPGLSRSSKTEANQLDESATYIP